MNFSHIPKFGILGCDSHPRALGFDDLIHNLPHSGIVLAIFVVKSITLIFEGLSARGAKINLSNLCPLWGLSSTCAEAMKWPSGACYHASVYMSCFLPRL
jgi:hypothetical protein